VLVAAAVNSSNGESSKGGVVEERSMEKRGARNVRRSVSSGGRLGGRLSTSTTTERTGW